MFFFTLLITFLHVASGNDLDLLLFDTSFREYIAVSRSSNILYQRTLDLFDDDVQFNYKNDSIQSIVEELTDYNKTVHHIYNRIGDFITYCPELVQGGSYCLTSVQDIMLALDLAIETYTLTSEEIEDDAYEKITELKQDFEQVITNCDERNSSSIALSLKISEYWYTVEDSLEKVEKMHVILKKMEHDKFLSTGTLNHSASVRSQSLLSNIRNVTHHVTSLGRAVQFCQKNILKYSLINNTSYL